MHRLTVRPSCGWRSNRQVPRRTNREQITGSRLFSVNSTITIIDDGEDTTGMPCNRNLFCSSTRSIRFLLILFFPVVSAFLSCEKREEDDTPIVKIGRTHYYQSDLDAFSRISESYPGIPPEFNLASRFPVTGFIECTSIYRKVRFSAEAVRYRFSNDWKWKRRYVIAKNFITDVLQRHMGYSDGELERYYNGNPHEFVALQAGDSAGIPCTTSVRIPLDREVKRQIAEKLFLRDYPPDSAFLATTRAPLGDEKAVKGHWIKYVRYEGYQKLFLKKYFTKKYGAVYPESFDSLAANGKYLSEKDMRTLISWMSEKRRKQLRNSGSARGNAAELLMRWYLFSEEAEATGYASRKEMRATLTWLWRYELAQRYLSTAIGPKVKKEAHIDSAMALYSYLDERGTPGGITDADAMRDHFKRLGKEKTGDFLDARLNAIRRQTKVVFTARTLDDGNDSDPALLLHLADSLREAGSGSDAEKTYRHITDHFAVTSGGKQAFLALAELLADRKQYTEAIRQYRRAVLTHDNDTELHCRCMFMAGFIYDEYLERPSMAEANYKWVLANAPGCAYAEETEFMMLHLGECVGSAEELRNEAVRQGRKTTAPDGGTAGSSVASEPLDEAEGTGD